MQLNVQLLSEGPSRNSTSELASAKLLAMRGCDLCVLLLLGSVSRVRLRILSVSVSDPTVRRSNLLSEV